VGKIGIMQGRLSQPDGGRLQCFPRDSWAAEFTRARSVPVDYIEWIFDLYGMDVNPICVSGGLEKLKSAVAATGVTVRSVCADYFLEKPFLHADLHERTRLLEVLERLLRNCRELGVKHVVLPFLEGAGIETPDDRDVAVQVLRTALGWSKVMGVEIHIESSLPPAELADLLNCLPDPMLKVTYDSGNSACLGYEPAAEFAAYGARVGSVHIKDRLLGGNSVPLGQGNACFDFIFSALSDLRYDGDVTLQVCRGQEGAETLWAKNNADFVSRFLKAPRG
jgi:hexulose-6-phosphate isomerase